MDRIGIRELRQNASVYVKRVQAGESFEVTDRGTPVAVLGPVGETTRVAELVAEGVLVPPSAPDTPLPRRVRASRRSEEVLAEQRDELATRRR